MKASYFSPATNRIFCYFGSSFDLFLDESLLPMSLPEILHRDLKRQGYQRIVFLDYTRGAYFLDASSKQLMQSKRTTDSSAPRLRSATRGRLLVNNNMAPTTTQPAKKQDLSYDISASEMIRYAGEFMIDASIKTAIVFTDGLNMLEHLQREADNGSMLNDLFKKIANINDLRNRNVLLFLFDRGEGAVANFLHGQNWEYVWTTLKAQAVFHHIAPVSAAEIRLALHYMRLSGVDGKRLQLDPVDLDDMCSMIAGKIQQNINDEKTGAKYTGTEELAARQLTPLMQYLLDYFILQGKELNMENCQKMCGKKAEKSALETLDEMIGMQELKDKLKSYIQLHARQKEQAKQPGLRLEPPAYESKAEGPNLHFVLTGKQGTGKSTAARLIGQIFAECGLLPSGHLVETSPSKLIGQYIGHSEANMRDAIARAKGGVLFIDEAYGFSDGSEHGVSYNKGMVNELVASMTAHKGEFAVVLAGYPQEMETMFSNVNPGLRDRFANQIHIKDYTPDELAKIFRKMAHSKGFTISQELDAILVSFMDNWYSDCQNDWANARNMENLLNNMIPAAREHLLTQAMLPENLKKYASNEEQKSIKERLNNMVGLPVVKQTIQDFENMLRYGNQKEKRNYHFVFAGNPGTGKTTIAEIFGQLLKGAGVLKSGTVCTVEVSELLKATDALAQQISRCRDRVLFIDEAYQLLRRPDIIDQLVEKTNPDRTDFPFCVICAGYEKEMKDFMDANAGNDRRFHVIHFDNYTPEDLLQIMHRKLKSDYPDYIITEEFIQGSLKHFRKHEKIIAEKYNAGYVGRYLDEVRKLLFRQFNTEYGEKEPSQEAYKFDASIIPQYLV